MNPNTYRLTVLLAFIAIYFIWGTTYLVIVVGLRDFPPFLMASIRFGIAGILLVGYTLLVSKEHLPSFPSILKNAFIGLVVLCGGQGLLIWSEQYIASGYASVLVATLPIWYVIMDRSHWKRYFSNPSIIMGVILGFAGILVLFYEKLAEPLPDQNVQLQLIASVAVLAGAVCWVVGTLYHRSNGAHGSIYKNLGWQLLIASVLCLAISFFASELKGFSFTNISWSGWFSVIYLAIAGSILAFVAYTWLLREMPSAIVGTYAYVNPVVAVFLGWILANEQITYWQMVGMVIILISAILVNLNRNKTGNVKK